MQNLKFRNQNLQRKDNRKKWKRRIKNLGIKGDLGKEILSKVNFKENNMSMKMIMMKIFELFNANNIK